MNAIKFRNFNIIVKARVHHSMEFSLPPLRPWVAFNSSNCVITAHCDCVAGLSECCSHVGAVLFAALQVVDQRLKITCTEKPCQWLQKSKTAGNDRYNFTNEKYSKTC